MASEEMRKKWGTIFMGEREASVEQLNAMQEPLRREKLQKEQTEDYMERVRARAADRAREILGAAYEERQKVLDEARAQIESQKREAYQECERLKAEAETARKLAQTELANAERERNEAERLREGAHDEGFQAGMQQASAELQEFRAELGQSLSTVLHALERERKKILEIWREDLVELVQCATQAGTGLILQKDHLAVLRGLVTRALDLLENRASITIRVNPADEQVISDMFRAARERYPELKQWIVSGDEKIQPGGIVAESGSGSVELKRENFTEMVDGVLRYLGLPEQSRENSGANAMREIVEREVAHIASLTPEPERFEEPVPEAAQEPIAGASTTAPAAHEIPEEPEPEPEATAAAEDAYATDSAPGPELPETGEPEPEAWGGDADGAMLEQEEPAPESANPYAELEEELIPLDLDQEEGGAVEESASPAVGSAPEQPAQNEPLAEEAIEEEETGPEDAKTLAEGGFL